MSKLSERYPIESTSGNILVKVFSTDMKTVKWLGLRDILHFKYALRNRFCYTFIQFG